MDTAGLQLQEKTVQHIVERNLSQEHIAQDLNARKGNLTEQARAKVNQMNLDLTPEQLKQKAAEELKKQVNEQIKKQPGFQAALAILTTLAAVGIIRRRN